MATKESHLPGPCRDLTLNDIYDVIIDIERRIHAVRTLVGHVDPNLKLNLVDEGIAKEWSPEKSTAQNQRIVCGVCHPVQQWPPFKE